MATPTIVRPENCSGCGTCELVCSFHNGAEGQFQPATAHIRVERLGTSNRFQPRFRDPCNGCGLCATHCDYGVFSARTEQGEVA